MSANQNKIFSFNNITMNPVLWLRADKGVELTGGVVSAWRDQSGNSNDAIQSTAGNRPSLVTNSLNGRPIIRFNLQWLDITPFLVGVNYSAFCVYNVSGASGTIIGGTSTFYFLGSASNLIGAGDNNGFLSYSKIPPFTSIISTFIIKADIYDSHIYENGLIKSTSISGTTQSLEVSVIGKRSGNNFYLYGDIAEIIIFDQVLTDGERKTTERYLNAKYAIY